MISRIATGGLIAVVLASTGCTKPFIQSKSSYVYYNRVSGDYEKKGYEQEDLGPVAAETPRNVDDPGTREQWSVGLDEVKRLALDYNKEIAFLRFQPGEQGTLIDQQLATFDPTIELGTGFSKVDEQVTTTIVAGSAAVNRDLVGRDAGFGTNATLGAGTQDQLQSLPGQDFLSLSKRNATGGLTRVSYSFDYEFITPTSPFIAVNPAWRQEVQFSLEQPLLQGAGVEFNRAPVLIARANQGQSIKDFETSVRTLLRDVEIAYWQLWFAYQDLYSRETGMKQSLVTWQLLDLGKTRQAGADIAQALEQYQFFRSARLEALGRVIEAERALRELLGLPPDDGKQIIPAFDPTVAAYVPQWDVAVLEAIELRPELSAQRFAIRAAELELFRQKNGLLPDLTVSASYSVTGLANDVNSSIDFLTDNDFHTWVMGIRYRQQIGERAAHAAVQRAKLTLSRQQSTLRNLEHTILHELFTAYQDVVRNRRLIDIQAKRRAAAFEQLRLRAEEMKQSKDLRNDTNLFLQAQTTFVDALRDEASAKASYNQSLASWEFAKGSILQTDNVELAETKLLACIKCKDKRRNFWHLPLPAPKGKDHPHNYDPIPEDHTPLYPALIGPVAGADTLGTLPGGMVETLPDPKLAPLPPVTAPTDQAPASSTGNETPKLQQLPPDQGAVTPPLTVPMVPAPPQLSALPPADAANGVRALSTR